MCLQIQDFNAKVIFGSETLYKEEPGDAGPTPAMLLTGGMAHEPFRDYLHGEVRRTGQHGLAAEGTAVGNGPRAESAQSRVKLGGNDVANPIYFCPSECTAVAARRWIAGARHFDVYEPTREEERQLHVH